MCSFYATQERILVLFFFCSDLALRALRAGLRATLSKLTRWSSVYNLHIIFQQEIVTNPRWSVAFLRGTVAAWVRCKGGWDKLLSGSTSNRQVFKKFFSQRFKSSRAFPIRCCCWGHHWPWSACAWLFTRRTHDQQI